MNPENNTFIKTFEDLKVCVLIPTYNNASTLKEVVDSVLEYTENIIIINDGSTDQTKEILNLYSQLTVVHFEENKGKGPALKFGFRKAWALGFQYAITIDSDGQHFANDLPVFLKAIQEQPGSLIIGARNMDQNHIPKKSSFGNRFSNFWFWVETGIQLPDTQSGYRLYPLLEAANMKYFSGKYEFEIEVPVRLAWKGVPVIAVPVSVYYPPADERVSHFRPFKDFTRISILNTFLTFIALLFIHPRNFILRTITRKGRRDIYEKLFLNPQESNHKKAISIAFGIFMGIFPVWGFQLAIGIPLAIYWKLNKTLFLIAANISIFPFTPIIWALSLLTGKIILGYKDWTFKFKEMSLEQFKEAGFAFFLGGAILAIVLGFTSYYLSMFLLRNRKIDSLEQL